MSVLSGTILPRAIAAAALCAGAAGACAADLDVRVEGLRVVAGRLRVAVAASADAWDDRAPPAAAAERTVDAASQTLHFAGLAPGVYAVKVLHDENGNGRLDTNLAGVPVEGYGFSRNPATLGKPAFEAASFELGAGGASIDVRLR